MSNIHHSAGWSAGGSYHQQSGAWTPLTLAQAPQIAFAALAIGTVVPSVRQKHLKVAFHASVGLLLTLVPFIVYSHTIIGEYDILHDFLQRFGGAYHLGLAVFYYLTLHDRTPVDPIFNFAQAITATLLAVSRLLNAYHLYETKARGIHVSPNYLGCALLADGGWALSAIYALVAGQPSAADEIDVIVKRTKRFIDGHASQTAQALSRADAAAGFLLAILNFAYPADALKASTPREFLVDDWHVLFVRDFAAQAFIPALISLFAAQFTLGHQQAYARQRIVTQLLLIVMQLYGHLAIGVYTPGHLIAVVGSIFYTALLVSIYIRVTEESAQSVALNADGADGSMSPPKKRI